MSFYPRSQLYSPARQRQWRELSSMTSSLDFLKDNNIIYCLSNSSIGLTWNIYFLCANTVMNMKNIYWRTFLPCRYFVVITGNMSVNASITPCTSNKNPFTHFSPNVKLNKGTSVWFKLHLSLCLVSDVLLLKRMSHISHATINRYYYIAWMNI